MHDLIADTHDSYLLFLNLEIKDINLLLLQLQQQFEQLQVNINKSVSHLHEKIGLMSVKVKKIQDFEKEKVKKEKVEEETVENEEVQKDKVEREEVEVENAAEAERLQNKIYYEQVLKDLKDEEKMRKKIPRSTTEKTFDLYIGNVSRADELSLYNSANSGTFYISTRQNSTLSLDLKREKPSKLHSEETDS